MSTDSSSRRVFKVILGFVTFLATATICLAQTGRDLNNQGMRAYKTGDYVSAMKLFKQAMRVDPSHAVAHYNFACTVSLLKAKYQNCKHNAYAQDALDALERAVRLDPTRVKRMREDRDLDAIRRYWKFQMILGKGMKTTEEVADLLRSIEWYGPPSPGAYGYMCIVEFKGTTVEFWDPRDWDNGKKAKRTGTFSVSGNRVILRMAPFQERGSETWNAVLKPGGSLWIKELSYDIHGNPGECIEEA